ncbi:MAG: ABC transporter substrate-binding protein [Tropicimonas sp.]|uniref:ABC transporter substrate-binding protein n=1 Tax=Tropicimonas sp. TaxID=2067044 RepID=UPI003A8B1076
MTIELNGIGWDHPRGYDCLVGATEAFHAEHPDIRITWSKRSLRDFGEAPIDVLARRYDFIIIDHPFSGKARQSGCLVDLGALVPDTIADLMADEIGQSTRSYQYDGGVWGLPTDAVSQVAAYRPDLLAAHGHGVPATYDEVRRLAAGLRAAGLWIGVPSCPTDAICQVLSYASNLGHPPGAREGEFVPADVLGDVLDILRELLSLAHPASVQSNPIQMFERMSAGDEVAYVPLAFGYSNYARKGESPLIRGADFAGPGADPKAGALLGGAGCALSTRCRHLEAATSYLRWLHRPEVMSGVYLDAGGQPGRRSAWQDARVNEVASNFFADTFDTIQRAYLRPRFDGFVPFMEEAGIRVNDWLRGAGDKGALVDWLRADFARAFENSRQEA